MSAPVFCWHSRHPATPEMRDALRAYRFVDMSGEMRAMRFKAYWTDALIVCGCVPDVIVPVAPLGWLERLVTTAAPYGCVVVRPAMVETRRDVFAWTGRWKQAVMVNGALRWRWWQPIRVYEGEMG